MNSVVYIKFYSSNQSQAIKADYWKNIKHILEEKYNQVKGTKKREKCVLYAYDENNKQIDKDTFVTGNITIKRIPQHIDPQKVAPQGVAPQKVAPQWKDQFDGWEAMTEDERINHIINLAGSIPVDNGTFYTIIHRSKGKKPHKKYQCFYCGVCGEHYCPDCPKRKNRKFVPVIKRQLPKGVPMSNFREANENERNVAYISQDGKFYMKKL